MSQGWSPVKQVADHVAQSPGKTGNANAFQQAQSMHQA